MRIALLLGVESAPIIWFANQINATGNVVLAIVEKDVPSKESVSLSSQKLGFVEKTLKYLLFRIQRSKQNQLENQIKNKYLNSCSKIFGSDFDKLATSIPVMYTNNINSKKVELKLKELQPDLILDHGTGLVKPSILSMAKLALNLHWGLSPYYRGVDCTIKALLNWDPHNIGVTIHRLAVEIDGGDIVAQKRIEVLPSDDTEQLNLKLTKEGTILCLKIIDKLKKGEALIFHKQQANNGLLVRSIHWNKEQYDWAKNLSENQMSLMLKKPSRFQAPIIELN